MAITKVLHMKANSSRQIDIHLKQSIAYILQPEKLGSHNLVGGINCLSELAYEQMKSTKQLFQKQGGRQGYHFILSLKPGEGTPEVMYDIAEKFAKELFHNEYETVLAVHTDKDHIHAHIIINSINMVTGHKFQYRNGDWKNMVQPITNKLCSEYELDIMPAEYSKDPKNMARPAWEREKSFVTLIENDAKYCALLAESEVHFIFLLKRLGYEVKEGKHIAVIAPGMKRYKRLDTISKMYARENLANTINELDELFPIPPVYSNELPRRNKGRITPYQNKYYVRLYRFRKIEKQRFTYKSAHYYEAIKKMHLLQEEYLLINKYNVNSYDELINLITRFKDEEKEVKELQKALYSNRAIEKRHCKTVEDFELFQSGEANYRENLEVVKNEKKRIKENYKIALRCIWRSDTELEQKLEKLIPLETMPEEVEDEIGDINIVIELQLEQVVKVVEKVTLIDKDEAVEAVAAQNNKTVEIDVKVALTKEDSAETVVVDLEETNLDVVGFDDFEKITYNNVTKQEYQTMPLEEKAKLFVEADFIGVDLAKRVTKLLERLGMDYSASKIFDEYVEIDKCIRMNQEKFIIEKCVDIAIERINETRIDKKRFDEMDIKSKAELFNFEGIDYSTGVKVYREVLERIGVEKDLMDIYDEFEKMYEETNKKVKLSTYYLM